MSVPIVLPITDFTRRAVLESGRAVELRPQPPAKRRLQHALAERNGLSSISRGREPNRRVVLLPGEER